MTGRRELRKSSEAAGARYPQRRPRQEFNPAKCVAVMEDSPSLLEDRRKLLENKGFEVLTPTDSQQCVELQERGCRSFVLDVDMTGDHSGRAGKKVEGLKALEDLKKAEPDTFCAVVTGNQQHRSRAAKFGADCFLSNEAQELAKLAEELDGACIRRALDLEAAPTSLAMLGEMLRKEEYGLSPDQELQNLSAQVSPALEHIDPLVRCGDSRAAAREMILVEPPLQKMVNLSESIGEGLGIGMQALLNAARNVSADKLNPKMWDLWRETLLTLLEDPSISETRAEDLADGLEEGGFNIDPANWGAVSDLLVAFGAHDLERRESD